MSVDASWAPSIVSHVAWVEVEGEVVILDPEARRVHLLQASGALLWQLFDGQVTVGELAQDVANAFHLDEERAFEDVWGFAVSMVEAGVLSAPERDLGART